MFEVGQWIWGIAVESDNYDEADVSGYLFMAVCGQKLDWVTENDRF